MSVKRKKRPWKPKYAAGDEVVSCGVGCKPSFVGVVVGRGYRGQTYHVRDADGVEWVRDERELSAVFKTEARAA